MNKAIDDAIEMMDQAQPLYGWAFMAEKQVSTSKMQMYFQNKRFEEVDKLLPKCMFLDPLSLAMKMAREYKHGELETVEKTFDKGIKRFKGEKLVLLYSTFAWMLLKKKDHEKAVEILGQAKEQTANEALAKNWQAVANNKPGQFSNAFLGEQWYALHLEKPKQKRVSAKAAMKNDPRIGKINRKMR
jgi:tetratricopeptide (TPR) repeat protein